MWTWILSVPIVLPKGAYDFRQIYAATYMVRSGHAKQLYDYYAQKDAQDRTVSPMPVPLPYVSPAYEALGLAPLAYLPFRAAYFAFLAVNLATLGLCFVLLQPWMQYLQNIYWWLPAALFLGFLPAAAALIEGQDSILLTTSVVGAWVLLTREHHFYGGMILGLALFKFSIVLPIAVLFLFWRQWRFLLGFVIAGVTFAGISVWLTGIGQARLYVETLFSIAGLRPPTGGLAVYPVIWRTMANIHGLVFTLGYNRISRPVIETITIVLSASVMGWTIIRGWRTKRVSELLLFAIPCAVLVSHHTYVYDLTILLLPLIVLLDTLLPSEEAGTRERWNARAAALMFVAPVMESHSRDHFYLVAVPVFLLLLAAGAAISRRSLERKNANAV